MPRPGGSRSRGRHATPRSRRLGERRGFFWTFRSCGKHALAQTQTMAYFLQGWRELCKSDGRTQGRSPCREFSDCFA
eukprot:3277299-Pyramimonas_sp.AAC.1